MTIISWNVNGLRSVARRNFLDWVREKDPDVLCLQEIKIDSDSLADELRNIGGYQSYYNFASKKGYAGVAIYTKLKPLSSNCVVIDEPRFEVEGRSLLLEFEQFWLLNLYLPHGGRDKSKLEYKLGVYERMGTFLQASRDKPLIVAGDLNVAHAEIDLARPRSNRNNIMFTVEERQKLTDWLSLGYVDSFRRLHAEGGNYTWWSQVAKARQSNIGWRIDYILVASELMSGVVAAEILGGVAGSDHCPVGLTLNL